MNDTIRTPAPVHTPPITRMRLAYMAVAMRDPNPVHMEDEFAAQAGLPSVIAHGTFAIGYLGATVSRHVGVDALTRLKVELTAPIFPGDELMTEVDPPDISIEGGRRFASAGLRARKLDGTVVARGSARWAVEDIPEGTS